MGYYTKYSIEFYNKDGYIKDLDFLDKIAEALESEVDYSFTINKFKVSSTEKITWYSWENHVVKISCDNPNILIVVKGEGESSGDVWQAEFLNGEKVSHWVVKVCYPAPSLHKLFSNWKVTNE